ncbi:MAG TPA: hypothetical protein VG937_00115 [Polyangiaceae bacterium]|nr:hypothetical protein [Polyangiaceae bacterium]
MIRVGDLGCPDIDVDNWRLENRVPLFRSKVNRWILVRTLRDDPSPDDLKNTLAATFMKWFSGTTLDPALTFHGTTRSATADLIKLERVSKERLSFAQTARRREDLPGVTPRLRTGEYVWLEVSFAYRGEQADMPWPVRTGAVVQLQSSAQCPVDADWILDSVAQPTEDAPPELSSSGKAWEVISNTATDMSTGALKLLWLPLTVVGAGLLLFLLARRA